MSHNPDWENEPNVTELEQERQEELNPKRTCSHRLFRMIKVVALACAAAMGIGQAVGLFFTSSGLDPIQYVLSAYMLLFCIVMMLNELEWGKFLYDSALLSNWISRGVIYSFVGVIGISENRIVKVEDDGALPKAASVYLQVVAYGMVIVGLIYFAMGVLCCQIVYSRARKDWEERTGWAAKKRKKEAQRRKKSGILAPPEDSVV